jgi:hypothetical protein
MPGWGQVLPARSKTLVTGSDVAPSLITKAGTHILVQTNCTRILNRDSEQKYEKQY